MVTHGKTETILAVIPSELAQHRLVLVMVGADADKPLILRSESFSPDVGWFIQSSVSMSRAELSGLKNVLGLNMSQGCQQTAGRVERSRRVQPSQRDDEPCVLPFALRRA
jgi:hypothetical protein